MGRTIPARWVPYKNIGDIIQGTRFIAFKVPLKEGTCVNLPEHERFTLRMLVDGVKDLGLIIDLTNTNRYYNAQELRRYNIQYKKIYCEGQVVPTPNIIENFISTVDGYLNSNAENNKLIGVHCTHGLNRTGYLVCRYMIERLAIDPTDAISRFELARGHEVERDSYISALKERWPKINLSPRPSRYPDDSRLVSFESSQHLPNPDFPEWDPEAPSSSHRQHVKSWRQSRERRMSRNVRHHQPHHHQHYPGSRTFGSGPYGSYAPAVSRPRHQYGSESQSRSQRQPSAYDYRPWERNQNYQSSNRPMWTNPNRFLDYN